MKAAVYDPRALTGVSLRCSLLAACMLFAGCTSHSATGTISGHLFAVGGPAPGLPRPLPGTIFVSGTKEFQVTVGSDGGYALVVPEGTYSVSGRSPLYQGGHLVCHARSDATVRTGAAVTEDVFCQER